MAAQSQRALTPGPQRCRRTITRAPPSDSCTSARLRRMRRPRSRWMRSGPSTLPPRQTCRTVLANRLALGATLVAVFGPSTAVASLVRRLPSVGGPTPAVATSCAATRQQQSFAAKRSPQELPSRRCIPARSSCIRLTYRLITTCLGSKPGFRMIRICWSPATCRTVPTEQLAPGATVVAVIGPSTAGASNMLCRHFAGGRIRAVATSCAVMRHQQSFVARPKQPVLRLCQCVPGAIVAEATSLWTRVGSQAVRASSAGFSPGAHHIINAAIPRRRSFVAVTQLPQQPPRRPRSQHAPPGNGSGRQL
mmetsp:Transcript_101104/g.225878  ORF Transcript_101104/g.225878 Transcript_101104/m.225878 type:complete len:307 (-) Transcript_101104:2786-3706(-)